MNKQLKECFSFVQKQHSNLHFLRWENRFNRCILFSNYSKLFTLVLLLFLFTNALKSQTPQLLDSNNLVIRNKALEVYSTGFIDWKCDSLQTGQLFTTLKNSTGLGINDSMVLIKTWEDSITLLQHNKYQQYYKNIVMEDVVYVEHSLNGVVLTTNGLICENMSEDGIPSLTESQALTYALAYVNASKYAWEDDSLEYYLLHDSESTITSFYPSGKLLWAIGDDFAINSMNFKLAWKFKIWTLDSPSLKKFIYVDAQSGLIIKEREVMNSGTFNHIFYGSQNIDTRWYGGAKSKYFLEADDNGYKIKTKDEKYGKSWGYNANGLPSDKDDNWGSSSWAATSCHWAVQESWRYWEDVFKRKGMDNNARPIRVEANVPEFNARFLADEFFDAADAITLGVLDLGLVASLDGVGHEYTHGVIHYTAGLENSGEPGALGESYSDIFGMLAERHFFGFQNWTINEDATAIALRDMQNPKSITPFDPDICLPSSYPSYYQESGAWFNTTGVCDFGGIHHNASVQNYCYYLLAMGGTQLGITVSGIGIDKAANIAQYALVNGLVTNTTTFAQNREAWVTAAKILYGHCSAERIQTCRAWAACNIGNPCPCFTLSPPEVECWTNRFREYGQVPQLSVAQKTVEDFSKIAIFPNPASEEIKIDFSGIGTESINSINSIEVCDIFGRTIYTSLLKINVILKIDISSFSKGVYFLKINSTNGLYSYKFIKI